MEIITKLRGLLVAATGGRWLVLRYGRGIDIGPSLDEYVAAGGMWDNAQHQADAIHIAAAHNSHAALLAVAEAATDVRRTLYLLGADTPALLASLEELEPKLAAALAELEALEL